MVVKEVTTRDCLTITSLAEENSRESIVCFKACRFPAAMIAIGSEM